MKDVKELAYKHALANAFSHKSKAQVSAVLGKVLAERPEFRQMTKHIVADIQVQVNKVNQMGHSEQKKALEEVYPEFFEEREEKKDLTDLRNAKKGQVVTRLPPGPEKHMHAGHAISFLINYLYAKKYEGKCILRFDDTSPEKDRQEYVNSMLDDIQNYLAIKPDKIVYASDDIKKIYKEIAKLIGNENAYVCFCDSEKMKMLRRERRACEHAKQNKEENKKLFQEMLDGKYKEGTCILRLRGNMKADNAAMRDPAIARIVEAPHYRQKSKFKVWPLYDFESACEEEYQGVTHVLRDINFGNERIELQKFISKLLGFKEREFVQYGRINIAGLEETSGRNLRALHEGGISWDDPRMPTLKALERRGFVKETFYELARMRGLAKTPMNVDESMISAVNRKFVDELANRYFFVQEPVKIRIKGCNLEEVSLKVHPSRQAFRKVRTSDFVFIPKKELAQYAGEEIRLKDFCNIKIKEHETAEFMSREVKDIPKIEWVTHENVAAEILMPTGQPIKGLAEKDVLKEKLGAIIQFERFGFARIDKKKPLVLVFAHK